MALMSNKKLVLWGGLVVLLMGLWLTGGTAVAQTAVVGDDVTFEQFGFEATTLQGNYDSTVYFFSFPSTWELNGEATLTLKFDAQVSVLNDEGLEIPTRARLQVVYNDFLLDSIPLENRLGGLDEMVVTIPLEALQNVSSSGRHNLTIILDSGDDCNIDTEALVVLFPESSLNFPHATVDPTLDLSLLPRPFFQRTFLPDEVPVVVPDEPTTAELDAAFNLIAGFGAMSGGAMTMTLTSEAELPRSLRAYDNMIFVGKVGQFEALEEVDLPAENSADGLRLAGAQASDGVVQLALTPWQTGGVLMHITSETDEGIRKAGQAASAGNLQVTRRQSLVVVSEVEPEAVLSFVDGIDQSFADLGYDEQVLEGPGRENSFFDFFIPAGFIPSAEAYIEFEYVHTDLFDFDLSGITIRLNGTIVGSIPVGEESTVLTRSRVALPASAARPGLNQLRVQAELVPKNNCLAQRTSDLWLVIHPESYLHIPLTTAALSNIQTSLEAFPDPFVYDPTLGQLGVVVPHGDVDAWRTAASLTFFMGDQVDTPLGNLRVAFADGVPTEMREMRHLLLVGDPADLEPVLSDINDVLPASYDFPLNSVAENRLPVTFRFPRNADLGYIQTTAAPWNEQLRLIHMAGVTPVGLEQMAVALMDGRLRSEMQGDFATVLGEQVQSFDSRTAPFARTIESDDAEALAEGEGEEETAVAAEAEGTPSWLLPTIQASIGLMGLIIAWVLGLNAWRWWRKRRA